MAELAAAVASLGVDDEDPRIATLRPEDVVAYALGRKTLLGIRGSRPRHFFAHLGFNRFAATETPVPARAEETETPSPLWLRELCFDKSKKRLRPRSPRTCRRPSRCASSTTTRRPSSPTSTRTPRSTGGRGTATSTRATGRASSPSTGSSIRRSSRRSRRPGAAGRARAASSSTSRTASSSSSAARSTPSARAVEAFHCALGAGGGVYALAVTATSCVFLRDRAMAKRSDVEPHLGDAGWAGADGVLYDRKPPRSPLRDVKLIAGRDD
ncbi:hypothetical protein JL722_13133 [Aureococcus anophagefferens]|nr:hypothetical protein JL722_13133 [Aureococcus anophagefferens]